MAVGGLVGARGKDGWRRGVAVVVVVVVFGGQSVGINACLS